MRVLSPVLSVPLATASIFLVSRLSVAAAEQKLSRKERIEGAVFGAFTADALCLGSHYEYDAKKIKEAYGGQAIAKFMSPGEKMGGQTHGVGWGARNYHPGKKAGGNTDYGDGNLYLLEYFSKVHQTGKQNSFSIDDYVNSYWKEQYKNWQTGNCRGCRAWMDTMTRTVLSNLDKGVPLGQAGGVSNGQVVRFAGALAMYDKLEDVIKVARTSTEFTNRNPQPIAASEFWARCVFKVMEGQDLEAAITGAASDTGDGFISGKVKQAIEKVKEATNPNSQLSKEEFVDDLALTSMARLWDVGKTEPIRVGKASPTEGTLPGAVYFILKYKNFAEAAKANTMVGGDNASRSIPIGIVLGAYEGKTAVPAEWVSTLSEGKNIEKILSQLPLTKADAKPEL